MLRLFQYMYVIYVWADSLELGKMFSRKCWKSLSWAAALRCKRQGGLSSVLKGALETSVLSSDKLEEGVVHLVISAGSLEQPEEATLPLFSQSVKM